MTLSTPPESKPVYDSLLDLVANALYGVDGNVHKIKLQHQISPINTGPWELEIHNDDTTDLGVFAVYIGDSESAVTGPNAWIRDNATVDPSGYHILSDPDNNLDTTAVPTPSEYWKSPSIRFEVDGDPTKNPVGEELNQVFVKLRNFGTIPMDTVTVQLYWTEFSAALPDFPSADWNLLGTQILEDIEPGEWQETEGFDWNVPTAPLPGDPNHFCLFAWTVTGLGEPLDTVDFSSTNPNTLTRFNTNAAHRNVKIITAVDPPPDETTAFFFKANEWFYVTNPTEATHVAEVLIKGLPPTAGATQVQAFTRPGDELDLSGLHVIDQLQLTTFEIEDTDLISIDGIKLEPGEQRPVGLRFVLEDPTDFDPAVIDVENVIEGEVMGGVTYVLEPKGEEPKPQKPKCDWEVGVYLGYTEPQSGFGEVFDGDLSYLASLGCRLDKAWSLELHLGNHTFSGESEIPDIEVFQASLNVRYTFALRTLRDRDRGGELKMFLQGGTGLYEPDLGSSGFGWNLGIGLSYLVRPRTAFEAVYNHHRMTEEAELEFNTLHLGFRWSF
ncbi:MAG: porin family protein [bacterium]|nr:porin family protein [bacterium]